MPEKLATDLSPEMFALADSIAADTWRNIEMLLEEGDADEATRALVRWSAALGTLALEVFESLVVLLRERKFRAAFMLARPLIDAHVRLRYYIVQAHDVQKVPAKMDAVRDWDGDDRDLVGSLALYEPDEWADEEQQRIIDAFGGEEPSRRREFLSMCDFLEKTEEKENEYRWARAAWLAEGALLRGERAVLGDLIEAGPPLAVHRASPKATGRAILFESIWYVLDLMDSFGMVRGWAFGAVKARQDAIRLYLATKPPE
jgi:hypothetical protein